MLPNFIVIGPGRTATTMLYEALKEHPEICMARNTKETNFYCDNYDKGLRWYEEFFGRCLKKKAIGEVCNKYIYDKKVPERIYSTIPNIKIIAVLRNPYERVKSVYLYRQRAGEIECNISFSDAMKKYPDLITHNYYGDQLNGYFDYFDKKNIAIVFYDDLVLDPGKFIRNIYRYIGVDSNYQVQAIHKIINPSVNVRHHKLAKMTHYISNKLRECQLYYLLERAKGSTLIRQLLFKESIRNDSFCSKYPEVKKILDEHFILQIKEVEKMTKRNLTHWYA